jgi:hypothetical protein
MVRWQQLPMWFRTDSSDEWYSPMLSPHFCNVSNKCKIEKSPNWKCQKCKKDNCFKCQTLVHPGKICLVNQRLKRIDPESLITILKTTKGCPSRKCGKRVEKHTRCKDTFCKKAGGMKFYIHSLDMIAEQNG